MNKIVTVMTPTGEYVGVLVSNSETGVTLKDPRMVVMNEQGGMGFANGIAMTGAEKPQKAEFSNFIFVTPTMPEVADAYREFTGQIMVPNNGGIIGA
jgi:hypothetical protein